MKLCTWVSTGQQWLVLSDTVLSHYEAVIDVIGSEEGIDIIGQYCVKLLSEISPWSYYTLE